MRGCFSVGYKHLEYPDNYCAVDWNHWEKGRWIKSWKSVDGSTWHSDGEPDRLACEAILSKFGLQAFSNLLAVVGFMSPASLVRFREERGLPEIDIFSDTPGGCGDRAEEYE